jgi:hypothetical protein
MKLHADSLEQLSAIAAMLQDALVPPGDMTYIEEEQSFAMAFNRFCWETPENRDAPYERVLAGLRFDTVSRVRFRGIDRQSSGTFLSLLTIAFDDGLVSLHFAGGSEIQLEVERLMCTMEDLGEPWPTHMRPQH